MHCSNCPNEIHPERAALGYRTCITCAERTVKRVRGDMNYGHKTGATLMVMSAETFQNYRQYVPYGKYTGRGSGTHKMSRPLTSLK